MFGDVAGSSGELRWTTHTRHAGLVRTVLKFVQPVATLLFGHSPPRDKSRVVAR